jgi:hypothetical protein
MTGDVRGSHKLRLNLVHSWVQRRPISVDVRRCEPGSMPSQPAFHASPGKPLRTQACRPSIF